VPDENPTGLGVFEFPLRSGGWQYADKETGHFWNWMRSYAAMLGRFDQFDPIGLHGGLNGYAFVNNSPLRRVDPMGLFTGPVHEEITRDAAKSCPKLEGVLPRAVNAVDSLSGSQLPGMSFMHGMCAPGQSPSQGMTATEEYIEREISKCSAPSLAKALHAGQDKHSPAHRNCQIWAGTGSMTVAQLMAHAAADSGVEGRADARMESEFIIARFRGRCPCLCD